MKRSYEYIVCGTGYELKDGDNIVGFEKDPKKGYFKYLSLYGFTEKDKDKICYIPSLAFGTDDFIQMSDVIDFARLSELTIEQMTHELEIYLETDYWDLFQDAQASAGKENTLKICLEHAFNNLSGLQFGMTITVVDWTDLLEDIISGCVFSKP